MKKYFLFLLAFFAFVMITTQPHLAATTETERVNILEEHNIEQKIKELSEEWQRHFVNAVNHFLERELKRLKKDREEPSEGLNGQIEKYEGELRRGSNEPETFFSLAQLYDHMEDGANAIINAKKAEKVFVEQKNVRGAAEARRSLRHYFKKYDYKPEDFELIQ